MRVSFATPLVRSIFTLLLSSALCAVCVGLLILSIQWYRAETRGIEVSGSTSSPQLGVNIAWFDLVETEQTRQAGAAQAAGFTLVRQRFEWARLEPSPGAYQWEAADRLMAVANRHGLRVVAVLVSAPPWARDPGEQIAPLSPPTDPAVYAQFVAQFVRRYQGQLAAVQVWDSPNLAARMNGEYIPVRRYVALLAATYPVVKAIAPQVIVLGGGMAATVENSPRNQNDARYLEWFYRAGGRGYFDALAIKPYGFWSGPDDTRVDENVLNFSRAVLLREIMQRYGDARTPVWAVEWGWNTLPPNWTGRLSPWGTDDAALQAERTHYALVRARAEWSWLSSMLLMHLRPSVSTEDPVWGFSLLDDQGQPRPALLAVQTAAQAPVQPAPVPDPWFIIGWWTVLLIGGGVVGWSALQAATRLPWAGLWQTYDASLSRLSEPWNIGIFALTAGLFAFVPWPFNVPFLPALGLLIGRRLDLALAAIVVSAPYFLKTIRLAAGQYALVEILTLLTFGAWAVRGLVSAKTFPPAPSLPKSDLTPRPPPLRREGPGERFVFGGFSRWLLSQLPLSLLDISVLALLILGIVSPFNALLDGVASREFRVIILEPVLFYIVLRHTRLSQTQLLRLADALVLAVAGLALYGFLTYNDVGGIAAEGVRRLRSVYGSPNNLALVIGRCLPILLALLVWGTSASRRRLYALALAPILVALFLTFSTGAWLIGVPAALVCLGLVKGRRALVAMLAAIGLGVLALLPFATTERVGRLLRLGEAQTLEWRQLLWQSAIAMIRDHPWWGVGLDNFLYEYRDYYIKPDALADRNLSHPHNLVLDFWTRLGVFGVVSLGLGVLAFFQAAWSLWRTRDGDQRILVLGLTASMVNFVVHGLIDNSYFLVDMAFIYMLTIGVVRNLERDP